MDEDPTDHAYDLKEKEGKREERDYGVDNKEAEKRTLKHVREGLIELI